MKKMEKQITVNHTIQKKTKRMMEDESIWRNEVV